MNSKNLRKSLLNAQLGNGTLRRAQENTNAPGAIRTHDLRFRKPNRESHIDQSTKELCRIQVQRAAPGAAVSATSIDSMPNDAGDARLTDIIATWPILPEHIRATISTLCNAVQSETK